jgi:zinc/manganese transport system substrate-binding protein
MTGDNHRRGKPLVLALAAMVAAAGLTACGAGAAASSIPGVVNAIGAENEYADVLSQVGGRYVHVTSILDNPNTDPHTFESSPHVAEEVGSAQLVVQNGLGYDSFINKIESAAPRRGRQIIVAQRLLGLPDSTPNPHLWYDPGTMPKVAAAMAADLASLQPDHAAYFEANLRTFLTSLRPWLAAIAAFKASHSGTPAATTEPVADYLLQAMGLDDVTPFGFQAAVMDGVDPSPQDISLEDGFLTNHRVKVFCYNQQVVDSLTGSIRSTAQRAGVPIVGVYETMPTPGYHYQAWMLAETEAIQQAVTGGVSTEHL